MAKKIECTCLCCNHPVVKKLIQFYCLIWGIVGLLFLIGMIWGMVKYKTWEKKGFFGGGTRAPQVEERIPATPRRY